MRSKVWFCDLSLAGIAGSNPAGGRDFVSCECCGCQVEVPAKARKMMRNGYVLRNEK